eukprot:GHVT01042136.1.p1 GENE.GHVT01042136.1~~GHVT01042136.1.p1  ORF type:complete len:127 (-),score=25.85 GHVT01042136.1:70-450(-)
MRLCLGFHFEWRDGGVNFSLAALQFFGRRPHLFPSSLPSSTFDPNPLASSAPTAPVDTELEQSRHKLSLRLLNRIDRSIKAIVKATNFAAVYIFDEHGPQWKRAGIEGILHVVMITTANQADTEYR